MLNCRPTITCVKVGCWKLSQQVQGHCIFHLSQLSSPTIHTCTRTKHRLPIHTCGKRRKLSKVCFEDDNCDHAQSEPVWPIFISCKIFSSIQISGIHTETFKHERVWGSRVSGSLPTLLPANYFIGYFWAIFIPRTTHTRGKLPV